MLIVKRVPLMNESPEWKEFWIPKGRILGTSVQTESTITSWEAARTRIVIDVICDEADELQAQQFAFVWRGQGLTDEAAKYLQARMVGPIADGYLLTIEPSP